MPIDPEALARKDASLARILQGAATRLRARVESAIGDAEAHATLGLTRSARAAPGGRATLAEIRRTRGALAAARKLDDLAGKLAALIEVCRADAYREARTRWVACLDPAWTAPDPYRITDQQGRHAVNLVVGGRALKDEAATWSDQASRTLEQAMVLAATDGGPGAAEPDELLADWVDQAARTVARHALGALEDSVSAMDRLAGRDCLKPSLLHPDPTLE